MMTTYPQVVLYGSTSGNWREEHIIPVLDELGVTYFDPTGANSWVTDMGDHEAEMMAHCETIVMVINTVNPSFASLAETGWAALGAIERGQHFILQVDESFDYKLPAPIRQAAGGAELEELMRHYTTSSRYLVRQHARNFKHDRLHVVDNLDGVAAQLRTIYAPTGQ
jgi:hypothetical protein